MTNFKTERLKLRPFEALDIPYFITLVGGLQTALWLTDVPNKVLNKDFPVNGRDLRANPLDHTEMFKWHKVMQDKASGQKGQTKFVVTLNDFHPQFGSKGKMLGAIGLTPIAPGECDLWIYIGSRYWNHGYATESVRGLIDYAAHNLNIRRIMAYTAPYNGRSERVMIKSGLKPDDKNKRSYIPGGQEEPGQHWVFEFNR